MSSNLLADVSSTGGAGESSLQRELWVACPSAQKLRQERERRSVAPPDLANFLSLTTGLTPVATVCRCSAAGLKTRPWVCEQFPLGFGAVPLIHLAQQ